MQFLCKLFVSLALAVAFVFLPAYATVSAQDEGEKARIIEDIIDLLKEEMWLERAIESSVRSLPTEQQELAREVISRIDQDDVYDEVAAAADEIYTTDELKAYYEFRSTEVGRSILRKQTQMNAKFYEILVRELLRDQSKD